MMECSGIVSIFENYDYPSVYYLLICGNWYEKLHSFWLNLSELFWIFIWIFLNFSFNYPLICGNWCEKLHTFWPKLSYFFRIFLKELFRIFQNFPEYFSMTCIDNPLICGNWCEKLHIPFRPVHVLLSRFYPDFILILSKFYPNFFQIKSG